VGTQTQGSAGASGADRHDRVSGTGIPRLARSFSTEFLSANPPSGCEPAGPEHERRNWRTPASRGITSDRQGARDQPAARAWFLVKRRRLFQQPFDFFFVDRDENAMLLILKAQVYRLLAKMFGHSLALAHRVFLLLPRLLFQKQRMVFPRLAVQRGVSGG
jgi:hypothetical protein